MRPLDRLKKFRLITLVLALGLAEVSARAGTFEYSVGFMFHRRNYLEAGFSWTRSWNMGLAYHFSSIAGVEFQYQDVSVRTKINTQDLETRDQVYSLNYIQFFLSKKWLVQPYMKVGIGQLNKVIDNFGVVRERILVDWITAVGALGVRLNIHERVSLDVNATSYLEGAKIETYDDNVLFRAGLSVYF